MQFILDHLSAMIISSVVVLTVVLLQARGSFTVVESHVVDTVQSELHAMHDILEWEIGLMATATQTNQAATDGRFFGPTTGSFHCEFSQTGNRTTSFTFPTLDIPLGTPDSLIAPIDSLDVIEVRYTLIPYGDSLSVWQDTTDQNVGLYRLERSVNDTLTGYLNEIITDFRIENASLGGGPQGFISTHGMCPSDMRKIRYEYRMVLQGMDFSTKDQRSTSRLNQGQFGITVHLNNW